MSCTQSDICSPNAGLLIRGSNALHGRRSSSSLHVSFLHGSAFPNMGRNKLTPRLVYGAPDYKRCGPVCANGGKGDEDFSWDSLKSAMGGLGKQQSVEDLLNKEMQKRQFGGNGGGGSPSGSGGGDRSGGPQDGDFAGILDELLQVIMATIGFIFVYVYLISRGEELTRLAKDYIKFLFGAKPSVRLGRTMDKWRKFSESITWTPPREDWLEREIVATPTWWHKPREMVSRMKSGRPVESYDDS